MLARRERALWAIAALSLVLVGACYVLVRAFGPLPGELRFEAWRVDGGYPDAWDRPLTFVTYLGDTWVAVASVLLLAVVAAEEAGRRAAVPILAAAGSPIVAEVLSAALGPTSQEYNGAAGVNLGTGDNFPSGHAAYAVSVFGVAAWLAFERGHRALAGALAVPVALMGPALAILGNHYPADLLAGYALGLAWAIGVLLVGERRASRPGLPEHPRRGSGPGLPRRPR
ncbi:MAG: phosphatase PAP2 family protein [Thermoleophilaceae bacterium]